MPTTLVDRLRAANDETLAALLRLRPDLAVPPPADLSVLATRAGIRASVHRACEDLDTVALAVLEALVVADADEEPAVARRAAPPVRAGCSPAPVDRALTALRDARADLGRRATGSRWSRRPATSCRAIPVGWVDRRPGRRVPRRCRSCSPRWTTRNGGCSTPSPPARRSVAAGPARIRAARSAGCSRAGCCCGWTRTRSSCRGRSALALRGDRPLGRGRWRRRPSAAATAAPTSSTAPRAAPRSSVLRRIELLVGHWGRTPPPVLRSGGLGVRELRRAAKEIDADESVAALLVELAVAADLVAESESVAPEWVPTTDVDVWAAGGPELRWSRLARCWLDLPRLPGLVGSNDDARTADRRAGRRGPPAARPARPAPGPRRAGRAAARASRPLSPAGLAELLAWRAPRRGGRLRDEVVGWVLAEATVLGVVALDALSTPGPGAPRRPRPADRGTAGDAARADRPRPPAGRSHRDRARAAGTRAGRRAGSDGQGRVGRRGHRLPVHRGHRSGGRSTPGALPPSCTSCWPPGRPRRYRRRCAT